MADRVTRVLLEIMAIDKATSTLKAMMNSLQGWADTMNGVGAKTELTAEQMEAAQIRLQGASDAYDASLDAQAVALGKLEAAQAAVAEGQQAAMEYELQAAAARQEAASAAAADAADLLAYADAAETAAAKTAIAVKASVDEQVAAYDKLMAADALVAKRSAQMADAQAAAGMEAEDSTVKIGKMGPMMLAAGAAAAYLTYKSVDLAANFQTSMTKLVTSAGESQSAMSMVSAGVLSISDQTGVAATDLAKALYYVDSAGYHAADSLTILTAAAKGARDEQANTADVTNAVTTVMRNYNMTANQATLVMNEMIKAVSLGKTNLQDFSVALAQVLPVAAASGVGFNEVGAALAAMTAKGMSAQQAAQDLAFTMRALQSPNGVAITELEQLGLSATKVEQSLGKNGLYSTFMMVSNAITQHMGPAGLVVTSAMNQSQTAAAKAKEMFDALPKSLQGLASQLENGTIGAHNWTLAIRQLDPVQQKLMQQFATMFTNSQAFSKLLTTSTTPATQAYTAAMSKAFGGAAGLNTALMLVSKQGVGQFTTNVQAMNAVAGQANKEVDGWSVVQGTFNQKMSEAKQTLINTGIAIGTALLPYVTKLLSLIVGFLTPIAQFITSHQKLISILLAVAGPLLMAVGVFLTLTKIVGLASAAVEAFDAVLLMIEETNPIILALTAVIVVIVLMIKYWKQIKEAIAAAWGWIKGHAAETAAAITLLLGPLGLLLGTALEIYTHWKQVSAFFSKMWRDVSNDTKVAWRDIKGALEAAWNWMSDTWNSTGGKLVTQISNAWSTVSGAVTREWDRISSDLSQIWGELVTLWNDTGGKLVSLISSNWDTIASVTSDAWHDIFDPIKQVISIFVNNIKLNIAIVETVLRTAWDSIKAYTKMAWDFIWGIIKAAWDLIYGIIKGVLDIVVGILKAAWDQILAGVKIVWDLVTGIINTALDYIKDILKVFIDLVTGKWGQMWKDIQKTATDVFNNVRSFIGNILNDITGFFSKAASDIGSGFINGLKAIVGGAWNALVGLKNTVFQFFSNAVNWLWQTGVDLITGLINGIEGWASHLWDSLSNLASGILSKIGSFLGLGSPSRYTHQYGIYLVEGLVNGINASAQKAAGAARSLAKGVLAGAQGTLGTVTLNAGGIGPGGLFAGAAGGAGGSRAVSFTVDLRGANVAGPQSVRWITDQINKEFVQKVVPTAGITTRRTGG